MTKFNEYVKERSGKDTKLPFISHDGLCSGLVAYWLYSMRNDEAAEFKRNLDYILNWDKQEFISNATKNDEIFEMLLNNIELLQFQFLLLDGLTQESYKQSFDLLRDKFDPGISAPEFTMTMVFDRKVLRDLLRKIAYNNKMIRFGNTLHSVGLIRLNDNYYFYNPNAESGPIETHNLEEIVAAIFTSLGLYCGSTEYIALNINVYDLANSAVGNYPNVNKYRNKLLARPYYKQAVNTHDNILHTAVSSKDYKMLDALFRINYKYIPWTKHGTTELYEAIALNDTKMLIYLLEHGIPPDYRAPNGISPIAAAIANQRNTMLYVLLQHGADINAKPSQAMSLVQIACLKNNPGAIILALASGYNMSKADEAKIYKKFGATTLKIIFSKSLALQNEIVKIIAQISHAIVSKPIAAHSAADLQEIAIIINSLEEIIKNKKTAHITKLAQDARDEITNYLQINNQPRPTMLLSAASKLQFIDLTPQQLQEFTSITPLTAS